MAKTATISWREIPLFRLLIPFIVGIALSWWTDFKWTTTPFAIFFLCLSSFILFSFYRSLNLKLNHLFGLAIIIWFICFSYWRAAVYNESNDKHHFSHEISFEKDSIYWWYAEVNDITPKGKSLRAELVIKAYATDDYNFKHKKGQLLLYLPPDSLASQLQIGSNILFHSAISAITPPLNPDAFNFANYQAQRNIFHQARITSKDWFLKNNKWTIRAEAMRWRHYFMSVLRKHLATGSNELAVGAALILGNKDELNNEIRNAYASTGAVHVLAVSGLHVGFIAGGVAWLLSFIPFKKKSWRWIRLSLNLLAVWAFALLTGLSPSVMRAACMFSFILVGQAFKRKPNIYNILAASALFLLLINPFLIFNIGFQLSYLAVLGIIYFQTRIYKTLFPSNKILDYFWKLTSVALAAQLATLPLSLYYFHQFPVYFLLSGIVVVTAASLILGLGVLLFITSFIPYVSTVLGYLLSSVLWLNNAFILALNEMPGGLISGIWINAGILAFFYLSILFLIRFINKKKGIELLICFGLIAFALLLNLQNQLTLHKQKSLIIYHQYKETIVDAFDGKNRFTHSTVAEGDPLLNWAIQPHREKKGAKNSTNQLLALNWMQDRHFIGFYEKRLLIVNRSFNTANQKKKIQSDIVLLSGAPKVNIQDLQSFIQAEHWVVDGSNPPFMVLKWIEEANHFDINIHWTAKEGAFQLEL